MRGGPRGRWGKLAALTPRDPLLCRALQDQTAPLPPDLRRDAVLPMATEYMRRGKLQPTAQACALDHEEVYAELEDLALVVKWVATALATGGGAPAAGGAAAAADHAVLVEAAQGFRARFVQLTGTDKKKIA